MGVSIVDVAAWAGVSKTTVSAVINNHRNVKPETREKVLQAIRELDYHPNLAARELITSNKTNIGILLPTYKSTSYSQNEMYFPYINEASNYDVVSQLIEDLSYSGYGVFTEHVAIGQEQIELPHFATSGRVLGVILISPLFDQQFLQRMKKHVPYIVQIGDHHPDCDCVYSSFSNTLKITVDYLVSKGHRRIALINADPASSTANDRLVGYRDGLQQHNITYNQSLTRSVPFTGIDGYRAFKSIWEETNPKPTALICSTDMGACGAMRYMNEQGIRVPEDISIVSNENGLICEVVYPTITVVGRDKKEIASEAAKLMLNRIKKPEIEHQRVVVQDYLVERASVISR